MAPPPLTPLIRESLGEQVHRTVRDLTLSQVYPPGSKLNVESLCRDLRVSRTPVWDAMRRLESEGLVNTVARHGVFVLNYSPARVRDLFAVRGALEGLAARLAAERADAGDRARLAATAGELDRAARAGDLEGYSRASIALHDHVLAASKNPVLARHLTNVYAQILVLRLRSLYLAERVADSLAEHTGIQQAVIEGDGQRAERLSRAHAEHVLADALDFTRRASEAQREAPLSPPARARRSPLKEVRGRA